MTLVFGVRIIICFLSFPKSLTILLLVSRGVLRKYGGVCLIKQEITNKGEAKKVIIEEKALPPTSSS